VCAGIGCQETSPDVAYRVRRHGSGRATTPSQSSFHETSKSRMGSMCRGYRMPSSARTDTESVDLPARHRQPEHQHRRLQERRHRSDHGEHRHRRLGRRLGLGQDVHACGRRQRRTLAPPRHDLRRHLDHALRRRCRARIADRGPCDSDGPVWLLHRRCAEHPLDPHSPGNFDGTIDDVSIYTAALNQATVTNHQRFGTP
jgi:hypothetical protein